MVSFRGEGRVSPRVASEGLVLVIRFRKDPIGGCWRRESPGCAECGDERSEVISTVRRPRSTRVPKRLFATSACADHGNLDPRPRQPPPTAPRCTSHDSLSRHLYVAATTGSGAHRGLPLSGGPWARRPLPGPAARPLRSDRRSGSTKHVLQHDCWHDPARPLLAAKPDDQPPCRLVRASARRAPITARTSVSAAGSGCRCSAWSPPCRGGRGGH